MFIVRQHTKFYLLMSKAPLAMAIKKRRKEDLRVAATVSLYVLEDECLNIGPGIESRWGRDFPHLSRPALGPTQPPVYRVFPGSKERPGRDAETLPPSSAVVKKEYS